MSKNHLWEKEKSFKTRAKLEKMQEIIMKKVTV